MECKGIITAMVTPMKENQEIDLVATKNLVNRLINKEVDGLFILGTNGEGHVLEKEEKIEFAKAVISEVSGRIPVYVSVGSNSTKETIEFAKKMEKIGATALSILPPSFEPPTQQELIVHYSKIASAVLIPIIIYNMPKKTGVNITPKTVNTLSKINNIIGLKDSSGDLDNIISYINVTKNERFSVLSGSDSLILDTLQNGGSGAVTAISNIFPEIFINIYINFIQGNFKRAKKNQLEIESFRSVLKLGTIPSILKESLNMAGIKVGPARLPVIGPNDEVKEKIKRILLEYKGGKYV